MSATIKVHDKEFVPFLTAEEIDQQIIRLANEINRDYRAKNPLFISILNGSFMFSSDLFKKLTIESEICFIKLASYKGVKSSGKVITAIGLDAELYKRHVVIIEDIVDTGKTMSELLPQLRNHHPSSLKICSLLHKPDQMMFDIKIDYLGFSIPNKFVVGYGLDYDGLGRNIPSIYKVAD